MFFDRQKYDGKNAGGVGLSGLFFPEPISVEGLIQSRFRLTNPWAFTISWPLGLEQKSTNFLVDGFVLESKNIYNGRLKE